MNCSRRLSKELADIKSSNMVSLRNIQADDNILQWECLLLPQKPPFDKGAFRVAITYPPDYPFKPPRVTFKTPIYHPNIDEKGQVCLPMISAENWKPCTKASQVLESLVSLLDNPEPQHPLRTDLAEEYSTDRRRFLENAERHTRRHSEQRQAQ